MGEYSLISMFFVSMLASSILPLGSEWLLISLIIKGVEPSSVVASATLGNYVGACTTYYIGYFGSDLLTKRVLKITEEKRVRAQSIYKKFGNLTLLLSWLPIIGDPLCFISGVLKYNILRFSVLVLIGKGVRYAFLAYITVKLG